MRSPRPALVASLPRSLARLPRATGAPAPQTARRASVCRHAPPRCEDRRCHGQPTTRHNDTATTPASPAPPSPRSVPVRNAPRQDVSGRCGLSRRWLSVAPTPLRSLSATRPAQRPLRLPRSTHCASAHWRAYPKDGQARRSHMVSLSAGAALLTTSHNVALRVMSGLGECQRRASPHLPAKPGRGHGDRHGRATAARVTPEDDARATARAPGKTVVVSLSVSRRISRLAPLSP